MHNTININMHKYTSIERTDFLKFKYPNSKKLYLTVEITQLLYKYNCTYKESEEILQLVLSEILQQKKDIEYDTIEDYISENRNNCDNFIINPLYHVEPYC